MLTPRENYFRLLRHEQTEYVPCIFADSNLCGILNELENGPAGGGVDVFGVPWVAPDSGSGAAIPAPGEFLLGDVTEWKEKIKFPDLDGMDWEKKAEDIVATYDPNKINMVSSTVGIYERLGAFMGFENALISMAVEPEAVDDLFTAITDYKIKQVEIAAKYLKADAFLFFDDIATHRSTFMSRETYRQLIKPHHKRLCEAILNHGMIPIQHTCGKAEALIEDFIEIGVACWNSVQTSNDIEGLLQKYGDQIALDGGYDTNGPPGYSTATNEEIEAEVRRCCDAYGKYKAYCFFGALIKNAPASPEGMLGPMMPMIMAFMKIRMERAAATGA